MEEFRNENNAEPKISDICNHFNIEEGDALLALESNKSPLSIFERNDEQNSKSVSLAEKLTDGKTETDLVDKLMLKDIIAELPQREQKIILLRYFRDKTQSEIAAELGISQVQISRIEMKILEKLKERMLK